MMQGSKWLAGIACAAGDVAPSTASASAARSVYPQDRDAISLRNGPAGWTGTTSSEGLCVPVLLCPAITNSIPSSGGPGNSGYLRTELGSLTGVGATSIGTFTGPAFKYRGVGGSRADDISLRLSRRADVAAAARRDGQRRHLLGAAAQPVRAGRRRAASTTPTSTAAAAVERGAGGRDRSGAAADRQPLPARRSTRGSSPGSQVVPGGYGRLREGPADREGPASGGPAATATAADGTTTTPTLVGGVIGGTVTRQGQAPVVPGRAARSGLRASASRGCRDA